MIWSEYLLFYIYGKDKIAINHNARKKIAWGRELDVWHYQELSK